MSPLLKLVVFIVILSALVDPSSTRQIGKIKKFIAATPIIIPTMATYEPTTKTYSVPVNILMLRLGTVSGPAKLPTSAASYFGLSASKERYSLTVGGQQVTISTDVEGHINTVVKIKNPKRLATIPIVIKPPAADSPFTGNAYVVPNEKGVSVISDIDDTVKVTQVLKKIKLVLNTFAREMKAVKGAAQVYQGFKKSLGATFHYVSASPYRLTVVLNNFFRAAGFPEGTLNLKRLNLQNWQNFVTSNKEKKISYKVGEISGIIKSVPKRRFILVGDSGEQDPEVYQRVQKLFPQNILHVFIRQVPEAGEPDHSEAYEYLESKGLLTKFDEYEMSMVDEMKELVKTMTK